MVRALSPSPAPLASIVPILIDGQNLFHALHRIGISEQHIDWEKFAQHLVGSAFQAEIYWFRAGEVRRSTLEQNPNAQKAHRPKISSS